MYLEEKIDLLIQNQNKLLEKVELFLPNLENERSVIHFFEITKNTFNTYIKEGILSENIHYIKKGKNRIFIPDEIIKLKKSGIKGKRKTSRKQDQLDAVNKTLGIITECRRAV